MMASAMLEAGALLERPDLETHALATLERLFEESAPSDLSGGIRHAIGSAIGEILDDQVQAASAALDAYEATGNWTWVTRAEQLMEHVWQDYQAPDGGLLDVPQNRDGVGLLDHGIKPVQDAPTPSPIGVAGIALARLAEHTGNDLWRARRDTLLEQFAGDATNLGVFGATLLRAFDWALMPVTHIVVVGADDQAAGLRRVARRIYRPRKVVTWLPPGATKASLPAAVQAMLDGTMPRAYVCTGAQCAAPVSDSAALAETLATFAVDAAE